MERVKVTYQAGQSRYSNASVDYMLAEVDGIELYAERPPVEDDETGSYEELKSAIIEQAQAHNIDVGLLEFWYDDAQHSREV